MILPTGIPENSTRRHGFTLIELLLVVILMAVVLGTAVVNYSDTFATFSLKKGADDLVFLMRYAKSKAISEGVPTRISFAEDRKSYRLEQAVLDEHEQVVNYQPSTQRVGRKVELPWDITLTTDQPEINFLPDGRIDQMRIILKSKKHQLTISTIEHRNHVLILEE